MLGARYHAILNPKAMVERGELFRGAIEDRYVGTFAEGRPIRLAPARRAPTASPRAIEVLRVAALSSYENRAISTGRADPRRRMRPAALPRRRRRPHEYSQALTAVKSFFRLVDGQRTLFLVGRDGHLLDIVDVKEWADAVCGHSTALPAPVPSAYAAHARATLKGGHVAAVLSPSGEIKLFAEGAQVLAFRHAHWHLLDLSAKFELWAEGVGNGRLAERLFQSALDLADARQGALFVVLRDPADAVPKLVASMDRAESGQRRRSWRTPGAPNKRDLLDLVMVRSVTELEPTILAALASLDGATVTDVNGRLIAAGAILRHAHEPGIDAAIEGARTTAAITASRYGPVLKVSEDGLISFFDNEKIWDI